MKKRAASQQQIIPLARRLIIDYAVISFTVLFSGLVTGETTQKPQMAAIVAVHLDLFTKYVYQYTVTRPIYSMEHEKIGQSLSRFFNHD